MGLNISRTISKITWDKGGVVSAAIRDGYGYPPSVAAKMGMTEAEFWRKHSMFRKNIEDEMRKERDAVMRIWAVAVDAAVLEWLFEASNGIRLADNMLVKSIKAHLIFLLRNPKGA